MTEPEKDQLFARVWATPAGGRLLNLLVENGQRFLSVGEIEIRLLRARKEWATGKGELT